MTDLRILHCIRAPVGGVFRHIEDLAIAQTERGHSVGVICDSTSGGRFEEERVAALGARLALGATRLPMRRELSLSDLRAARDVLRQVGALRPDVLHGHGAKGGAYARLIGTVLRRRGAAITRLYSPHGGSLHYDPRSVSGRVYFRLERLLERVTDGLIFVSDYERRAYRDKIGRPRVPDLLVMNGLRPDEFEPVEPAPSRADFLFIGELRDLKGTDVFLRALARIPADGRAAATALVVGKGPDEARYRQMVAELGLDARVRFEPPMRARLAFAQAGVVVVPSRAESLPYIVLETIAAGVPVIATAVGGIPEIVPDEVDRLVPPGDDRALAAAMAALIADPAAARAAAALRRDRLADRFSVARMTDMVTEFYRDTASRRHRG